MTALQKNIFAHCTMHFNTLFPCSSAIIPVTVWFFTPTLSGTVRHFMTCLNFFWNHIIASKQQMCENHVLRKRSIKLYCITVSLAKFYNMQMPGSYWQLHDLLNWLLSQLCVLITDRYKYNKQCMWKWTCQCNRKVLTILIVKEFWSSKGVMWLGLYQVLSLCYFSSKEKLCSLLTVRDQVSHPCKIIGSTTVLYLILFITFLDRRRGAMKYELGNMHSPNLICS